MKLMTKIMQIYQDRAKRETLVLLRGLSDRQLRDGGFSPELLKDGVKAWPWREIPENFVPLKLVKSETNKSASVDVSPNKATNKVERELVQDNAA